MGLEADQFYVPYREEILRGIRLAAVAFASMLLCMAAYRVLNQPAQAPEAPAPPQVAQPPIEPSSTQPQAAPEPAFQPPQSVSIPVPPPPPLTGAKPKPRRVQASTASPAPIPVVVAPAETTPTETVADSAVAAAEQPAPQQVAEADSSSEPIIVQPPESPRKPNPGSRFVRAVGRALHIVPKKDPAPDALK